MARQGGAHRSTENENQEQASQKIRNLTSRPGGQEKNAEPTTRNPQMGSDISESGDEEEESGSEDMRQTKNRSQEVAKDDDDDSEESIGNT